MKTCFNCGASISPAISWCGQCYQPLVPYRTVVSTLRPTAAVRRAEATALGLLGRVLITALVAVSGIGLHSGVAAWTRSVGEAGAALGFVVLGLYATLAVVVLWATWRPARRPRRVYIGGPVIQVTPIRRRADDGRVGGS